MHKRDVKRFDVPSPLPLVNTSFSSTQSSLPPFLCVNASPSFFFFFFERERERGKKGKGETSCSFRYRWRGQGKETLKRNEHANVEEVDLCTINQVPGFWIEFIKKRGGLCIEFRTIIVTVSNSCNLKSKLILWDYERDCFRNVRKWIFLQNKIFWILSRVEEDRSGFRNVKFHVHVV